jgi:cation-transporting ATPase E
VLLLAVVIGIVAGGCILHAPFFEIAHLRTNMVVVSLAAGAPAVAFFNWLYDRSLASYETDERFTRLVSRLEGTHDHRRNRGL